MKIVNPNLNSGEATNNANLQSVIGDLKNPSNMRSINAGLFALIARRLDNKEGQLFEIGDGVVTLGCTTIDSIKDTTYLDLPAAKWLNTYSKSENVGWEFASGSEINPIFQTKTTKLGGLCIGYIVVAVTDDVNFTTRAIKATTYAAGLLGDKAAVAVASKMIPGFYPGKTQARQLKASSCNFGFFIPTYGQVLDTDIKPEYSVIADVPTYKFGDEENIVLAQAVVVAQPVQDKEAIHYAKSVFTSLELNMSNVNYSVFPMYSNLNAVDFYSALASSDDIAGNYQSYWKAKIMAAMARAGVDSSCFSKQCTISSSTKEASPSSFVSEIEVQLPIVPKTY